jgi:predicted glycosyltransferase
LRAWIDFSNSPHPLLFAPIVRKLESLGHEVLLTTRDHAQTISLARERWPTIEVIGGASPASATDKVRVLAARVSQLRRWAAANAPDVALSHNSYAQIIAARSCRIPVVTAMDYEHQPANHLAFRLASRILLPDVFPSQAVRRFGGRPGQVRRYHGLKELLYLGDFVPSKSVLLDLGLSRDDSEAIVVVRTPPTGALYHRHGNSLFVKALRVASQQKHVRCVVLARTSDQRQVLMQEAPDCLVPDHVVDARSLMHAADLVIGAGGTMTREAALLRIPTYSVFAGKPAAADSWLESQCLLRRLVAPEDLAAIRRRPNEPIFVDELRARGEVLVTDFVDVVAEVGTEFA